MSKECLWYTNSKPITSSSNRNVKLIIQKTQKTCKIITLITKNINAAPNLGSCRNQIKNSIVKVKQGYSSYWNQIIEIFGCSAIEKMVQFSCL